MLRQMISPLLCTCFSLAKKTLEDRLQQRTETQPSDFVIFSHPRSGSNFFRDILNQHPHVLEVGEYLHQSPSVSLTLPNEITAQYIQEDHADAAVSGYASTFDDMEQIDLNTIFPSLVKLAKLKKAKKIGFTLFPQALGHRLSNKEACQLALQDGVQVIFLIRRNLLQSFVSFKRAIKFGAWHLNGSGSLLQYPHATSLPDALKRPIGPIDIDEAEHWIDANKTFFACLEQSLQGHGKEYCTVYYEDLCLKGSTQTLQEANRVLKFLHMHKIRKFTPHFAKTASTDFYQTISNREELAAATGYSL